MNDEAMKGLYEAIEPLTKQWDVVPIQPTAVWNDFWPQLIACAERCRDLDRAQAAEQSAPKFCCLQYEAVGSHSPLCARICKIHRLIDCGTCFATAQITVKDSWNGTERRIVANNRVPEKWDRRANQPQQGKPMAFADLPKDVQQQFPPRDEQPAAEPGTLPEEPDGDWFAGLPVDVVQYVEVLRAAAESLRAEVWRLQERANTAHKLFFECAEQKKRAEAAEAERDALRSWLRIYNPSVLEAYDAAPRPGTARQKDRT